MRVSSSSRTVPRDLAQLAAEHFVRPPEQIRRFDKFRGQVPAHTDRLRALAGKEDSDFSLHARDQQEIAEESKKAGGAKIERRPVSSEPAASVLRTGCVPEICRFRVWQFAIGHSSCSMPVDHREIEAPDPLARTLQAQAESVPNDDQIGEKMVLNMGPSHPATHGVLRLVLELDGEVVTKATPDVGYLHRGDEKIAENMQYNQFVPYTDRLDYLAPLANNVAYALAVEKLMGWELPPRGKAIRVICCEMARISAHLLGLGAMALDLGAMTVFLYTFTEREKLYNLFELLTGARFTTSYTRVGGQIRDLPPTFIPQLRNVSRWFHSAAR